MYYGTIENMENVSSPGVTMIDDLPTLETLERSSQNDNIPQSGNHQIGKFIRQGGGNMQLPKESGMTTNPPSLYKKKSYDYNELDTSKPHKYQSQQSQQSQMMNMTNRNMYYEPTCLDVCNHINSCPLCSRFYNNDKTGYIIVIIVLTIICLLLLKRVLNV